MNALPLELCPSGIEFVIHKISVFNGLFIRIKIGRLAIRAIEGKERVTVDVIGRGSRQTDLSAIEILQHFVELIENLAMDFIEDDQVKEGRRELLEDIAQRLQGNRVKAICSIDLPTMETCARLIWQILLEAIVNCLLD